MTVEHPDHDPINLVEIGEVKKRRSYNRKRSGKGDYPKKPGRPFPGFRKNFYDYFAEYSNNTGIHGFKYMGDQEMSIFERLVFISFPRKCPNKRR